MNRSVKAATAGAAALAAGTALAASPLAQASGGLWEISGPPGLGAVRQCVGNPRVLAQFEHRREACPQTELSRSGSMTVIQYNCRSGGFGRSEVTLLTPRSLRIETQGISGGQPFHYVIQARRVGDCRH